VEFLVLVFLEQAVNLALLVVAVHLVHLVLV
jgi:hypothetical protein